MPLGLGRLAVTCDSTELGPLWRDSPLARYLSRGTAQPRVASLGGFPMCQPGDVGDFRNLPRGITWLGAELPPGYEADAGALARDWDVLVVCGVQRWRRFPADELSGFSRAYGRGLLLGMDYAGQGSVADQANFDLVNALARDAGLTFLPVRLDESSARLSGCLPP